MSSFFCDLTGFRQRQAAWRFIKRERMSSLRGDMKTLCVILQDPIDGSFWKVIVWEGWETLPADSVVQFNLIGKA